MKSNYLRHFVTACICLSAVLGSRTAAAHLIKVYGPNVTDEMSMEKALAATSWLIYRARSVTRR